MSHIYGGSRRFFLGVAFVSLMGGTGGFTGAIAGLLLVLVSHEVLGMSAGMVELMLTSVGLGALASMCLGVFLTARALPRLAVARPRLVTPPSPTSNQVPS